MVGQTPPGTGHRAPDTPDAPDAPPADAPGPAGPGRAARWTTRQWLRGGVTASLAVLVLLGLLVSWDFAHSSEVTDKLVDRSSPALVAAVRLEAGLVDQETGIRGYGLTGRTEFLDPYQAGLTEQQQSLDTLTPLVAEDSTDRADLALVLRRAEDWQARIARPLAAAPAGAANPAATALADEGKQLFDAVRTATAAQQQHLQAERAAARTDLQSARELRDLIFSLIGAVLLTLAILVFEGLRRGVTKPLELLAADAELVTRGSFEHPINPTGPADLRQLARTIEAMRRRLAEELSFSDQARRTLDEQAADLRRSNTELEQFAYVASHDLQEPLRKVASFCQLLQRRYAGQLDDRADQYIAFAVDGANRMQTLINDLLAFSRVGRLHADHQPVALEGVFADTVDALSMAIEESGAEISHDPLPEIRGDATQLSVLLQNLLSNAIKFRSPERAPRIHLEAVLAGDHWQLAVRDNGIGIEPEFADKVFVIFQRLHTRIAYPGNGIGLAMCKKIVDFHGGTIGVDLAHSPGTRITFTLPAEPGGPAKAATDGGRAAELDGAGRP
ncbi:CHASE3 domain-containing protein [Kitasatospora sp. NBC_01287]|uniref:sensor histidine kinase n=1 Tax=Kitasatospora sp. NBC_01287 TaxID=2903573 RepID=UPI00224CC172|nr:sensor histidine kinase [Kitasatospora sp. NBC_01287]MCX4744627.1 CHASE3 domain-containing protein [Kitasatospora sp. NBC_01287]